MEEDQTLELQEKKTESTGGRGWGMGKKLAIAGVAVSSAPIVLPPLVLFSALGLVFSVPFGLVFAGYAFTDKLMRRLLPPSREEEADTAFQDNAIGEKEKKAEDESAFGGEMEEEEDKPFLHEQEEIKRELSDDGFAGEDANGTDKEMKLFGRVVVGEIAQVNEEKEKEGGFGGFGRDDETGEIVEANEEAGREEKADEIGEIGGGREVAGREGSAEKTTEEKNVLPEPQAEAGEVCESKMSHPVSEEGTATNEQMQDLHGIGRNKEENSVKHSPDISSKTAITITSEVDTEGATDEPLGPSIRHVDLTRPGSEEESAVVEHALDGIDTDKEGDSVKNPHDISAKTATIITSEVDIEEPNDKFLRTEVEIWEQINAMRMIVGYKATPNANYIEELNALYLFTGVEPPASLVDSSGLIEVNDKIGFLKSVVGVE